MAGTNGADTWSLTPRAKARARLWQSMRILRRFTLPMLMTTAETKFDNTRIYVRALCVAGLIRQATPKRNGRKGGHMEWILVRDAGPRAPRVQKNRRIYDPNTHTVIEGENHERMGGGVGRRVPAHESG